MGAKTWTYQQVAAAASTTVYTTGFKYNGAGERLVDQSIPYIRLHDEDIGFRVKVVNTLNKNVTVSFENTTDTGDTWEAVTGGGSITAGNTTSYNLTTALGSGASRKRRLRVKMVAASAPTSAGTLRVIWSTERRNFNA